ncbi:MAG: chaperone modulator CbpM [Verrucomicrobiota bacterium]
MNHEPEEDDSFDIDELARLCGMNPETILEYSRTRIISLHSAGGTRRAGTRTLHRLRRISTLQQEHHLPGSAVPLILNLLDRLEAAEHELRALRDRH